MIHGHIGALLFLIKLQRKAAKNKLNYSSQTQLVQNFSALLKRQFFKQIAIRNTNLFE